MKKQIVDARGELCPKPIIMTKKALKGFVGELTVLLDNETAFQNVQSFLSDNGKAFETKKEDGVYYISLNSDGNPAVSTAAENYCTVPVTVNSNSSVGLQHVIAFKCDKMGSGDEELGKILIQGFCNTIKETDPLPGSLVFYNSGVKLALADSPVISALKELEKQGIRVLVCGTCADFFNIKDKIAVGKISNMYDILECLSTARHIISP